MPSIPNKTDSPVVETAPVNLASEESASQSTDDLWKAEYEAQVQSWRAQSAEAREKAEKERARWEAIRAAEKTEANRLAAQVHDSEHGWETVGPKSTSDPSSSQQTTSQLRDLADAGDPVLGASQALQVRNLIELQFDLHL